MPNVVVQKKAEVDLIHTELYTNCHTRSSSDKMSPLLTFCVLAALYICTRPQLQYMRWKEGPRPGTSYFCMPGLVLFILRLGCSPLV